MYEIIQGDVVEALQGLRPEGVQCCVTSPPYWGLRDYGTEGQIGLESTPQEYVEKMVEVFGEVRRVLRDDGTLWLNIGDSYSQGGYDFGMKPKDLCLIPYRLILALQDDGWWVRSQIVWAKKSAMPESVRDRPTSAWEPIFLLTKSQKYYYDAEAVRQGLDGNPDIRSRASTFAQQSQTGNHGQGAETISTVGANLRNVWHLGPEPFPDAHFATFPTEIPRRAIMAGSKKGDTVLDPFLGSGTTCVVANQLERDSIGIELSPEYAEMAEKRIQGDLSVTRRKNTEGTQFTLQMM